MWKSIKNFFGFEGVADSALKIVDKIAGTDWTPQQKAKFTLEYMESTKHQSPARRMIACGIMIEHLVLVLAWTALTLWGSPSSIETAASISAFLKSNINITLDIIIAFYFLVGMKK